MAQPAGTPWSCARCEKDNPSWREFCGGCRAQRQVQRRAPGGALPSPPRVPASRRWMQVALYVLAPVLLLVELVGYAGYDGGLLRLKATTTAAVPSSQQYDSPEGRFSVRLPGAPETDADASGSTTCAGFQTGAVSCVAWVDLDRDASPGELRDVLRAVVQSQADDGGRVVRTADVDYLGRPAVDFVIDRDGIELRGRSLVVGRRAYTVFVLSDVEEPAAFPVLVGSFVVR